MSLFPPCAAPTAADIIGDVHGHADKLHELLHQLGYSRNSGVWQHPEGRQAIFVGDLIDSGPDPRGVLQTVAAMQEAGGALCVMGNHEYNALLHHLPGADGRPLRRMTERQLASHEPTLRQFTHAHTEEWKGWLQWMHQLPLWLDAGPFRVVHACWDRDAMAFLIQSRLTGNLLRASAHEGAERQAIETLLKGPVLVDPGAGIQTLQPIRLRWWEQLRPGFTLQDASIDPLPAEVAGLPLPPEIIPESYPLDVAPLFVGHYNRKGRESLKLTSNIICVDAGIAHEGNLAAYRVDQSQILMV